MNKKLYKTMCMAMAVTAATAFTACSGNTDAIDEAIAAAGQAGAEDEDSDAITVADFPAFATDNTRSSVPGTPENKTAWAEHDKIYVRVNGTGQWYVLEYSAVASSDAASAAATYKWVAPSDFKMQKGDTYEAVYAPNYEPDADDATKLSCTSDPSKTTGEYLTCTGSRPIYISFERQYSRLRVNCGELDSGSTITVSFGDGFTSNVPGSDVKSFTITPTNPLIGDAYIYGSWEEGTKLDVSAVVYGNPEKDVTYTGVFLNTTIKSASVPGQAYGFFTTSSWKVYNLDKASGTKDSWTDITNSRLKVIGTWSDEKALTFKQSAFTDVDLSGVTGLTATPEEMFEHSTKLTSVILPEGLETISKNCFYNCSSLSEITIPKSVKAIGQMAFYWCDKISKVNISDIDAWCNIDFYDSCSNPLRSAKHLYLNGEEVTDVIIPESCTTINNYLFYKCIGLSSVTIPSSVVSIGNNSFSYTGLTSLTIPASVSSISDSSFWYCQDLKSIDSSSSAELKTYTFFYCTSLKTVILRSTSRVTISGNAFPSIPSDACLYVPSNLVEKYKANTLGGIKADNVKSIDELPEEYK